MGKKQSGSSAQDNHHAKNVKHIKDSEIDFSDIPESTDLELKKAVRVGRPPTGNAKQLIAIRIAPKLLTRIKKLANRKRKPYQTVLHDLLEQAMNKLAA